MNKQKIINVACFIGFVICVILAGKIDTWFLALGVIK